MNSTDSSLNSDFKQYYNDLQSQIFLNDLDEDTSKHNSHVF